MFEEIERFTTLHFASVGPNFISVVQERCRLLKNVRTEPLMPRRGSESNKRRANAQSTSPPETTKTTSAPAAVKRQKIHGQRHLRSLNLIRNRQTEFSFYPESIHRFFQPNSSSSFATRIEFKTPFRAFMSPTRRFQRNRQTNKLDPRPRNDTSIAVASSDPVPFERSLHAIPTHEHTTSSDESSSSKQLE